MSLLAEQTLLLKCLAESPRASGRMVELDCDPQASASHFFDVLRLDGQELLEKIGAVLGRALHHLLVDQDLERFAGHRGVGQQPVHRLAGTHQPPM